MIYEIIGVFFVFLGCICLGVCSFLVGSFLVGGEICKVGLVGEVRSI